MAIVTDGDDTADLLQNWCSGNQDALARAHADPPSLIEDPADRAGRQPGLFGEVVD